MDTHMVHTALFSLKSYLNQDFLDDEGLFADIGGFLRKHRLVVIRDAFKSDFAEQVHTCLDRQRAWCVYEGYGPGFHYHHHNVDESDYPPLLKLCKKILNSVDTRQWISNLTHRDCSGEMSFSPNWFLPGDHSTPHTDFARRRQVAFVWHLTRDWEPDWGGDFYWCRAGKGFPPSFNTLYLFLVSEKSVHAVLPVTPFARSKRLGLAGWWTGGTTPPKKRPGGTVVMVGRRQSVMVV